MPRGKNRAFLERAGVGNPDSLPANQRNQHGRFDTPRAQMGRAHALSILNDPDYQRNLLERMIAGEAGAIEVWIWRLGYGEPRKDETEDELARERFAAMRAEVREFLRSHPEQARVIDAKVQGAVRMLPAPRGNGDDPA